MARSPLNPKSVGLVRMPPLAYHSTLIFGVLGGTIEKSPLMEKCGRLMCGSCSLQLLKNPEIAFSAPDTVDFATPSLSEKKLTTPCRAPPTIEVIALN